jgi:drug/metabolite transporter (DMT)-like permease
MQAPPRVYLFLALGIITFGLSASFVRMAGDADPYLLASGRLGFSLLFLFPFWLRHGTMPSELSKAGIRPYLPVLAGVLLGLHFALWITSVQLTSVAEASVLVTMHPIFLIVLERLVFGRRFSVQIWGGVAIALTGSAMLGFADATNAAAIYPDGTLGNLLAVLAALMFAVYFVIGRSIRTRTGWVNYTFHVYFSAFVTTAVLLLVRNGFHVEITSNDLFICLLLAVGPTLIGHGAMNYAVRYFSATSISTLILVEAGLASLFAFLIFGERPPGITLIAMSVIVAGILLTWAGPSAPDTPEAKGTL